MTLFFSPARASFHDDRVHRDLPDDAIRVTARRHQELLARQAGGARIVAGADGRPIAAMPPVEKLAHRRERAIAAVKREARRRIEDVVPLWRQVDDAVVLALAALAALEVAIDDARHAQIAAIARRRAEIDVIRRQSDLIEAEVAAMNAEALAGFTPRDDVHWLPAPPELAAEQEGGTA